MPFHTLQHYYDVEICTLLSSHDFKLFQDEHFLPYSSTFHHSDIPSNSATKISLSTLTYVNTIPPILDINTMLC